MKLFAIATAVVLNGFIGTQCTSIGSKSVVPSHWYPSLNGSPNMAQSGALCPLSLRSGYFGGSIYDGRKGVMVELRILSKSEVAISVFFRNGTEMVYLEIPNVRYSIYRLAGITGSTCVIQLDEVQKYGTRVKLFPSPVTSIETTDIHKLIPELFDVSETPLPSGIVASQSLIYGIVPVQRVAKVTDWRIFLEGELASVEGSFLTPSVVSLLSHRVTPTKSTAYVYGGSSSILAAIMLIAFATV